MVALLSGEQVVLLERVRSTLVERSVRELEQAPPNPDMVPPKEAAVGPE